MDSPDNSAMISAIRLGNVSTVAKLIDEHGLSCEQWSGGYNLLLEALQCKHIAVAKLLLSNGANVNDENSNTVDPSPLHVAVKNNEREIVEILLQKGANINMKWGDELSVIGSLSVYFNSEITKVLLQNGALSTPLHVACGKGCKDMVELLLDSGAEVNARAIDSRTPLHIAVEKGFKEIVEVLVNRGASIVARTGRYSYSPLHIAVKESHKDVVDLLLKMGAPVDVKAVNSVTPLHLAVQKGDMYIIAMLLDGGANIDATQDDLHTPLQFAVEKARKDIVELLLSRGADVNAATLAETNLKPLLCAAFYKQLEIADVLLKYGADVNVINEEGVTPIYFATVNADFNMFQLFLTNGAVVKDPSELLCLAAQSGCSRNFESFGTSKNSDCDAKYENARNQSSPNFQKHFMVPGVSRQEENLLLHGAQSGADVQIAEYLLQNGANVNSDRYGETPLHSSVRSGCLSLTQLFLEQGAKVNTGSKRWFQETPLHIATEDSDVEHVKILLEYGADVNAVCMDDTPLRIATRNRCLSLVNLLVEYGADVNLQRSEGTALHLAARNGHLELVKTLLEYESDINIISTEIATPLECALAYDCLESTDYLSRHIVKMTAAGFYVSERNLRCLESESLLKRFPWRWTLPKMLVTLMSRCHEEIQIMKNNKIADSCCTYYDILTRSARRIVRLLGNDTLVQTLNEGVYRDVFPIYASMISSRFELAKKRRQLQEESKRVFFVDCVPLLPNICMDRIIRYLTNGHLLMLIRICCPANCPSRQIGNKG